MTDWYFTDTARRRGFTARPVVGGVFMQLLNDGDVWKKYASRERTHAAGWAPMPRPPKVTVVVPTAQEEFVTWQYTTVAPGDRWPSPQFDASGWKSGPGGFGVAGTPGAVVRTVWNTSDVWLRREFQLSANAAGNLALLIHHDEDVEVYLNGIPAGRASGYRTDYGLLPISPAAAATLKPGKNLLAIHCHQTLGGQYIDAGLVRVEPQP